MSRIVIAVLISVLLALPATAAEDFFKVLCIDETSIGFNWENGSWKQALFKNRKHLIEKVEIEPNSKTSRSGLCHQDYDPSYGFVHETSKYVQGCYNISAFGDEFNQFRSEICMESWDKKGELWKLRFVGCDEFVFKTNGEFQAANIGVSLSQKPKDDYKDSLHLTIGTCSKL